MIGQFPDQLLEERGKYQYGQNQSIEERQDKELVVPVSDAVVEPRTVMVHLQGAQATDAAMVASFWFWRVADAAVSVIFRGRQDVGALPLAAAAHLPADALSTVCALRITMGSLNYAEGKIGWVSGTAKSHGRVGDGEQRRQDDGKDQVQHYGLRRWLPRTGLDSLWRIVLDKCQD